MPRGWLGRTSLKWPILCRVGRTTLTESAGDICGFKPLMTIHLRVRIANDEYKCRMVYAKVHVHHDQGVPFTGFRQSADLWVFWLQGDCVKHGKAYDNSALYCCIFMNISPGNYWMSYYIFTHYHHSQLHNDQEQTRHWISWCWDGSVVLRARCGKDSGVCGAETSGRLPCVVLVADGASDDQYSRVRWVACASCLYSLVYLHFFAWFVLHSSQEYLDPVMFWCKPESGV